MKWSVQQLYKLTVNSYDFSGEFDFRDYIANIDDIYDISTAKVSGNVTRNLDERYIFNLNIKVTLVLQDARTLDPVEYPLDLDVVEVFDIDDQYDEDIRIIEANTIDLKEVVWENILLEKPIRVVKEELNQ